MNIKEIKLTIAFIASVLFCGNISAQEQTLYLHYTLNPALINGAYAGFNDEVNISFNYRNRWTSFEGAPRALTAMVHSPLTDRLGGGLSIFSEKIGDISASTIGAMFSYELVNTPGTKIRGGLTADYHFYGLDQNILNTDPQFFDIDDPLINAATEGTNFIDFGFGVYGEIDNAFTFGLTLPNLLFTRTKELNPDLVPEDDEDIFSSYLILLGYRFDVPQQNFSVEPSIAFKKERFVPFHTDFNLRFRFIEDKLLAGLTYSSGAGDRFAVLVGTKVSKMTLAYSYDVAFNDFQDYSSGAHEVTLGLRLARGN